MVQTAFSSLHKIITLISRPVKIKSGFESGTGKSLKIIEHQYSVNVHYITVQSILGHVWVRLQSKNTILSTVTARPILFQYKVDFPVCTNIIKSMQRPVKIKSGLEYGTTMLLKIFWITRVRLKSKNTTFSTVTVLYKIINSI